MQLIVLSCVILIRFCLFLIPPNAGVVGIMNVDDYSMENILYDPDCLLLEYADTTVIEIKTEGIELSYSLAEIQAEAGDILLIRYINESDMSHNIVLVREEADIRPVGIAAFQAASNHWIPENEMHRIIAHSELVHAGETTEFSFKVPPPGTYPYICTYSAHWTEMKGLLISTE